VQNPKVFGSLISEIKSDRLEVYEKTHFSMMGDPKIRERVEKARQEEGIKTIFIWGLMAEACVSQSALDLLKMGYEVYLVKDGITSISHIEKEVAIKVRVQS
jgi:nicotinamidase-related amidase